MGDGSSATSGGGCSRTGDSNHEEKRMTRMRRKMKIRPNRAQRKHILKNQDTAKEKWQGDSKQFQLQELNNQTKVETQDNSATHTDWFLKGQDCVTSAICMLPCLWDYPRLNKASGAIKENTPGKSTVGDSHQDRRQKADVVTSTTAAWQIPIFKTITDE